MYIKLCLTLSVSLLATDTWCIYCMYHCDNGSFIISVMMISSRTTLQIFHWNVHITMYINSTYKLEKVDLVITDTPAFQILNEAMKGMKHVVTYLTTYSFHGHQKFTNSCNWQCSKLFIACQINLNQITCNHNRT